MSYWRDYVYRKTLVNPKEVMIACHPDKNPGDKKSESVYKWAAEVRSYKPSVIKNGKKQYPLDSFVDSGDVSDVYRSGNLIVKVSTVKGGDVLLKNEFDAIQKIMAFHTGIRQRGFFFEPIETFVVSDVFKKRVCIYQDSDGFLTLKRLKTLANVVNPVHMSWIYRRTLEMIHVCHAAGYVHGSVLPQHILINPETHGGKIIGLTHGTFGGKITTASEEFLDFLSPEIKAKKEASHVTDVYMATRSAQWLGTCPDEMHRFFTNALTTRSTPEELYCNFGDVLKGLYGKRKFIPLEV